jgi:hypothetical protein
MNALLVILASPFWGTLSAQLFLHGALASVTFVIYLIGFFTAKEQRSQNLSHLGYSLLRVAVCAGLLYGGHTLISDLIGFRYSDSETIVYWLFAIGSIVWMLPQVPAKLRATWRHATITGAQEKNDLFERTGDQVLP